MRSLLPDFPEVLDVARPEPVHGRGKPFERVMTKQQVHTGDMLVCPPGIRTGLQTR